MRIAKASEADLRMALDLSQMLEAFERGSFPCSDDMDETDEFDSDNRDDCLRAMEMILDKLQEGRLFRVTFGMSVLLDPKNEAVDPACDHLAHHPKVRMHDELVEALRESTDLVPRISGDDPMAPALADWLRNVHAVLAKVEGR